MNARRVVLHVGVSKTGSSALQAGLVQNRAHLAEAGVHYPASFSDARALRSDTTSGNGLLLTPFLAPRVNEPEAANAALTSLHLELDGTEAPTLLYSSESLFRFEKVAFERLRDELHSRDVQVQVALFARDITGHAWSAYVQMVKRRSYTGTFSDYLAGTTGVRYNLRLRDRLEFLADALGPQHVVLLHYDSLREGIFREFVQRVLGVSVTRDWIQADRVVNRTLTPHEVAYMRRLNTLVRDPQKTRILNNVILSQRPIGAPGHGVTPEHVHFLDAKFGSDVEWVNTNFFAGPILKVSSLDAAQFRRDVSLQPFEDAVLCAMADPIAKPAGGPPLRPNPS